MDPTTQGWMRLVGSRSDSHRNVPDLDLSRNVSGNKLESLCETILLVGWIPIQKNIFFLKNHKVKKILKKFKTFCG